MYHYRCKLCVVGCGKGVGVEYSASSVDIGIGQNYDMFIGYTGKFVVQLTQTQRGQVSVRIEGAEM